MKRLLDPVLRYFRYLAECSFDRTTEGNIQYHPDFFSRSFLVSDETTKEWMVRRLAWLYAVLLCVIIFPCAGILAKLSLTPLLVVVTVFAFLFWVATRVLLRSKMRTMKRGEPQPMISALQHRLSQRSSRELRWQFLGCVAFAVGGVGLAMFSTFPAIGIVNLMFFSVFALLYWRTLRRRCP